MKRLMAVVTVLLLNGVGNAQVNFAIPAEELILSAISIEKVTQVLPETRLRIGQFVFIYNPRVIFQNEFGHQTQAAVAADRETLNHICELMGLKGFASTGFYEEGTAAHRLYGYDAESKKDFLRSGMRATTLFTCNGMLLPTLPPNVTVEIRNRTSLELDAKRIQRLRLPNGTEYLRIASPRLWFKHTSVMSTSPTDTLYFDDDQSDQRNFACHLFGYGNAKTSEVDRGYYDVFRVVTDFKAGRIAERTHVDPIKVLECHP